MKNTLLFVSLMCVSANAALYTLNNGSAAAAAGIITPDGKTFRSGTTDGTSFGASGGTSAGAGTVGFGVFNISDALLASATSASTLANAFVSFGNVGTFAAGGPTGNRSNFSSPQNITITGSAFADKSVYLFVGNGSSFALSTSFLIAKMDTQTFLPGDDTTFLTSTFTFSINPANSTPIVGSEIANVQTANTDSSTTAGWLMAAPVPEASTSLLGAIGALVLLRRRRN